MPIRAAAMPADKLRMSGPFESGHAYSVPLQAAKQTEILPYRRARQP
jgi:hypothetical protein